MFPGGCIQKIPLNSFQDTCINKNDLPLKPISGPFWTGIFASIPHSIPPPPPPQLLPPTREPHWVPEEEAPQCLLGAVHTSKRAAATTTRPISGAHLHHLSRSIVFDRVNKNTLRGVRSLPFPTIPAFNIHRLP